MDVVLVQCLVEGLPMDISAFDSYADRLVVSTAACSLLVYSIAEEPSFSITLAQTKKGFSKSPAKQLVAVPEANLLLALDEQVSSYDLSTLTQLDSFPSTKGATLIALHPPSSVLISAEHKEKSELSDGFQRFASFDTETIMYNNSLSGKNGLSTPAVTADLIHSVLSRLLAVVIKKRLLIFKTDSSGSIQFSKELALPDRPHIMQWLSATKIAYAHPKRGYFTVSTETNEIIELHKFNTSLFSKISSYAHVRLGIVELPNDRLLLTNGDSGVFVNTDGSPLVERDLEWSGAPSFTTFSTPYVVGLIGNSIEIRSLTTGGIVQNIEFPAAENMGVGGDSLIYTHVTEMIKQIEFLIASNQFNDAQRLIEELEFSSEDEKAKLRASPIDIVNLFPQFSLLEGQNSEIPVTDKVALNGLKDYLIQQRQILSRLRRLHQQRLTPAHHHLPPGTAAAATAASLQNTTAAVASSIFSGSDQGVPDAAPTSAAILSNAEDTVFLSSVVDTTLLKVYLAVNERLVGSLVRVENYCDVEEVEAALKARKKYNELIDFYNGKGLHRKALELLTLMKSVQDMIKYFQKLDINLHVDLFIEFSGPIFERVVDDGMKVFMERYEEGHEFEARYAEHLVGELKSDRPEFHDRLILLYLQYLVEYMSSLDDPPSKTTGGRLFESEERLALSDDREVHFLLMRRKLVEFLQTSQFYRPSRVFPLFPEEGLHEERILLLAKLGRHTESLKIIVETLQNHSLAQRYCEIYHSDSVNASSSNTDNLFITLLSLFLAANSREKLSMDEIITYMVKYGAFIDGPRALYMLPRSTNLQGLTEFFAKTLQRVHQISHAAVLGANTARLEHIQVQQHLIKLQSQFVDVRDDETVCARCGKKIGNSVFATWSSFSLAAAARRDVVHIFCLG
ncbi:Vam6/Vps39-like protein [Physocladia obscura]|uniref:Vam6/Vps39-like protein n=1 Tax=Physocladia obscura TaxID=109957 RepID=A0AAD5SXW6_9FUNG|nr:Vam6/Vps39-like protein [Physocladia obscura]